jgi:hypothetical protein
MSKNDIIKMIYLKTAVMVCIKYKKLKMKNSKRIQVKLSQYLVLIRKNLISISKVLFSIKIKIKTIMVKALPNQKMEYN